MRRFSQIAVFAFFIGAALWLAADRALLTRGLRLATHDDEMVMAALADAHQASRLRLFDFTIGRIYADAKFSFFETLMSVRHDTVHAVLRVGLALLAACAAGYFVWEWLRQWRLALLVGTTAMGLLQVSVSYQPLLSQSWFWLGWAAIWGMAALALRPDSVANRCGLTLAFSAALIVHESNALFLPWVIALRLWQSGQSVGWRALRPFCACTAVLAVYAGLSLLLRLQASDLQPVYSGSSLRADPGKFFMSVNVYSLGSFPGLESWRVRWPDARQSAWLTPPEWFTNLRALVTLPDFLGAALVSTAAWLGLAPRTENAPASPKPLSAATFLLLIAAAYIPNLLLAATQKYQLWAQQRMWPYYYSSMSYLVWVVILVAAADVLLIHLKRPRGRATARLLISLLLGGIALTCFATSREATAYLRAHSLHHINSYPHSPIPPDRAPN